MSDEPVIFEPKRLIQPPKAAFRACALCDGTHATWWTNAQAPSCFERQKRKHG